MDVGSGNNTTLYIFNQHIVRILFRYFYVLARYILTGGIYNSEPHLLLLVMVSNVIELKKGLNMCSSITVVAFCRYSLPSVQEGWELW